MNASIEITRGTTFQRHDAAAPDRDGRRCIRVVAVQPDGGELSIRIASATVDGDDVDVDVVLATSALIVELEALRAAAIRRLAFATVPQQLQA